MKTKDFYIWGVDFREYVEREVNAWKKANDPKDQFLTNLTTKKASIKFPEVGDTKGEACLLQEFEAKEADRYYYVY